MGLRTTVVRLLTLAIGVAVPAITPAAPALAAAPLRILNDGVQN